MKHLINHQFSFKANRLVWKANGLAPDLSHERDINIPQPHEVGGKSADGIARQFRENLETLVETSPGVDMGLVNREWGEIIQDEASRAAYLGMVKGIFRGEKIIISQGDKEEYDIINVAGPDAKRSEVEPQVLTLSESGSRKPGTAIVKELNRLPVSEALNLNPAFLTKFLENFPNRTPIFFRNPVTGKNERSIVGEVFNNNSEELPSINILIESDWRTISAIDFVKLQPTLFKPEAGASDSSGKWIKTF